MKLQDKVAIITGGAGGIGQGIALAYAKEGAKVVIVDRNAGLAEQAIASLKSVTEHVHFIEADLSAHDKLKDIVEEVIAKYGRLDVLINNAHASNNGAFENQTQSDMELSFNTGFYPTFYLMQAALPYLKETNGSIINFASGDGINGSPYQASYAAAKEAIRAITRVASNEWAKYDINVNLISPIANTPGIRTWGENNPELYQGLLSKIPMGRLGDPETDIGRVAVFLGSEDASFISGQTIVVDGGTTKVR